MDAAVDDAGLLARFARGDGEAFTALVARHGGSVCATCRRIAGADGDDAAQAVFLVLARRAQELAHHPSLSAWLHRTAVHIACDHRSAQRARRAREEAASMDVAPRTADRSDASVQLDEAIEALPDAYRRAVIGHYLDGVPLDSLARADGVSEPAMAMRLSRARERLRRWYARRGIALAGVALLALLGDARAGAVDSGFSHAAARLIADGDGAIDDGASALAQTHHARMAARRRRRWLGFASGAALLVIAAIAVSFAARIGIEGTRETTPRVETDDAMDEPPASIIRDDPATLVRLGTNAHTNGGQSDRSDLSITRWADRGLHHLPSTWTAATADTILGSYLSGSFTKADLGAIGEEIAHARRIPVMVRGVKDRRIELYRFEPMPLRDLLDHLCTLTDTAWESTPEGIVISPNPAAPAATN